MAKTHDPLGPLDFVTSFFATLLAGAIALIVASAVFGWGGSTLGMGGRECVRLDRPQNLRPDRGPDTAMFAKMTASTAV